MKQHLSRAELIELVQRIQDGRRSEQQQEQWLEQLIQSVPHPDVSNLIFWNDEEWTAERIVDEALAYHPIILGQAPNED
ncbi:bacteriocin immunity protein [Paenibacillus campi]|uniref:bacteriocin immunity protein n=1 Tax=Paenibacillus campi TaxID=3106031 RepID=UPI002AFF798A|nr:bacteriocin immunity protein [Paenibacillus sp. SGZ-1014]